MSIHRSSARHSSASRRSSERSINECAARHSNASRYNGRFRRQRSMSPLEFLMTHSSWRHFPSRPPSRNCTRHPRRILITYPHWMCSFYMVQWALDACTVQSFQCALGLVRTRCNVYCAQCALMGCTAFPKHTLQSAVREDGVFCAQCASACWKLVLCANLCCCIGVKWIRSLEFSS